MDALHAGRAPGDAVGAKGVIGPVRLLRAAFCFDAPFDPQSRLFNPDLCGGALLDAGVYPIEFAMGVLGEHPVETAGVQLPAETGVDAMDLFSMRFPSGAMAELSCSISLALPTDAVILGARGSIVVRDFLRSTRCELYDSHGDCVATFTEDVEDGFVYEIEHFCALFESGAKESPSSPSRTPSPAPRSSTRSCAAEAGARPRLPPPAQNKAAAGSLRLPPLYPLICRLPSAWPMGSRSSSAAAPSRGVGSRLMTTSASPRKASRYAAAG